MLQASLEAYGAVRREGRLADRALEFTLRRKKNLYSQERRAVAERVYGLLRRQLTIDAALARAKPGFASLSPSEQDVLRLAASRVLHGEPPRLVARTSALGAEDAQLLESRSTWEPPSGASRVERLSLSASLPPFLAQKFIDELGEEAEEAAAAMNVRAPLTGRVNGLKGTREELLGELRRDRVEARPTSFSPFGVALETRLNAFSLKAFQDGRFELQDEGSQLLGMLVDAPPTVVIDACAGAGGKTLQLAAQMKNRGDLHAWDIDERRLDEMRKRARRAGVHNVRTRVVPADGELPAELVGKADRVLVDAPCSGSGTFRRKPDARYRLNPEDLAMHVGRQKKLLERFSALVKPGGRLIYGTCSIFRDENESVVEGFLAAHPDFSVRSAEEELGPSAAGLVRNGFLRLYPHRHGTDGFFGAILVRRRSA